MRSDISYGYLLPRSDRIEDININIKWDSEQVGIDDWTESIGVELPGWSRGTDVKIMVTCQIDLYSILEDCHLPSNQRIIGGALVWRCPSTSLTGASAAKTISHGFNHFQITVDGNQVSSNISVELCLFLSKEGTIDPNSPAPYVTGSYLWTQDFRIHLEGAAAGMRILRKDFTSENSQIGYAMWSIDFSSDLEIHASRGITILLNSAHPRTKKALELHAQAKDKSKELENWNDELNVDLRIQLVTYALYKASEEDLTEWDDDPESFGFMLLSYLRTYFPHAVDYSQLLDQNLQTVGQLHAQIQSNYYARKS